LPMLFSNFTPVTCSLKKLMTVTCQLWASGPKCLPPLPDPPH
jgi:hypothetical protein